MSSRWISYCPPHCQAASRPAAKTPGRVAMLFVIAALSLAPTGCSVMHNGYTALTRNGAWNETVIVLRNRSFSAKAWHRRKHAYCNEKNNRDFCAGFRAGYEAVAAGGDGCTPVCAPGPYLGWQYQSAEGQSRTHSWFAGFPHGVRAAEEDGVAHWNQVYLPPHIQAEYQNAGVMTHEGNLYPIPDNEAAVGPHLGVPIEGQIEIIGEGIPLGETQYQLGTPPLPSQSPGINGPAINAPPTFVP